MGLQTFNQEKKTYVSIIGGKFTTKADEGNPNAIKRTNKENKLVYEIHHDAISGRIRDLKIEDSSYGQQLIINVDDVGDIYQIQIPVESKYFWSLAMKVKNIKFVEDVMIIPYSFDDKEKINPKTKEKQKVTGINFYHNFKGRNIKDADKVGYYYSKDEPKDKPMPDKPDMDEDEYKIFKIREKKFFVNLINNLEIPSNGALPANQQPTEELAKDEQPIDDLPF